MRRPWIPLLAALTLAAACRDQPRSTESPPADGGAPATGVGLIGPVIETMDSGGYTYVLIKTAQGQEVWAAGPPTVVDVGQVVEIRSPMPMADFRSRSLDRTFESIYFGRAISMPGSQAVSTGAASGSERSLVDAGEVARLENGVTVEEVFLRKDELVGAEISLRAQVVKFTPDVLGKNWLHLQDGTGSPGTNDLTITTAASAKLGDTVVVRGVVLADKDYGFGYRYDLIVEDAEVIIE